MKLFPYLFFIVLGISSINAQNKSKLDQLVSEYHSLFKSSQLLLNEVNNLENNTKSELFNNFLNDKSLSSLSFTSNIGDISNSNNFDIGLKWVSDYSHNFGIGSIEDENFFMKSRISSGVDWLILGEGSYTDTKKNKQRNLIEAQKDSLELAMYSSQRQVKDKINQVKFVFDYQRLNVFKKIESFYAQKVSYNNNLFEAKLISYAEMIKAKHDHERIANNTLLLDKFLIKNEVTYLLDKYKNISFVDLEIPQNIIQDQDSFLSMESQILALQKEQYLLSLKKINQPSLRTKFRYNFYNSDGNLQRNFASIGASLTVPIRFGNDHISEYKLNNLDTKIAIQNNEKIQEFQKLNYEFQRITIKLSDLQNDLIFLSALINNELEIYNSHSNKFNPEKAIDFSLRFLYKKLEWLDVKQVLAENFIRYHYLVNSNLKKELQAKNQKSTYIWSDTFKTHTNQELVDVLKAHEIQTVLLSPGKENIEKLEEFHLLASKYQIKILRLISENSYARTTDFTKLNQKLDEVDIKIFSGVHLNIEPHTFDDYQMNKQEYIQNMNLVYENVNRWCLANNTSLSVSIPMHLPEENIKFLHDNNVQVYVMAYENVDQNKLLNRTKLLRNSFNNNIVWVLRLNDFKDEKHLKQALIDLEKNQIHQLGFYEISALLQNK